MEDEAGKGGSAWSYVLRVHRPAPAFEVWTAKSSFAFRAWSGSPAMKVFVVRSGGFDDPVKLDETPDFRFSPAIIPAGTNMLKVAVISKQRQQHDVTNVQFTASAKINGKWQKVRIQPADEYNQAFAWDHLLPTRAFVIRTWPNPKALKNVKPPAKPVPPPKPKVKEMPKPKVKEEPKPKVKEEPKPNKEDKKK